MKKLISLGIAVMLMLAALVSCGNDSQSNTDNTDKTKNTEGADITATDEPEESKQPEGPSYSEGLELELSEDGTGYIVTGIGDCKDSDIVIPSEHDGLPVIAIDDMAFSDEAITSIIIGDCVEVIGEYAFNCCSDLVSVVISDSVVTIKEFAFEDNMNLSEVTMGSSVETIEKYAFVNCPKLLEVTIHGTDTIVAERAFDDITVITYE